MDIKKLILVDGKLYIFSPNEKAEVGDISQCKYTGKYEILTENNITYMTGYYLWKPVDLCLELSNEEGLTYKATIKPSKIKYSVKVN
jgi:hypothetical protein